MVGHAHADDAAVFALTDDLALVQTVDFFTPIVDDPFDFGRIAANALSDVFAMGGTPQIAVNILCFPDKDLGPEVLAAILQGGHQCVHEAGAVLGGGHSVSDKELKYGLAVTGTVHPQRFWQNEGALPGDVLVLTKALGTGVLSTALKRVGLDEARVGALVDSMAALNMGACRAGQSLWEDGAPDPVHAATDITGYGLLGHSWEVAKASQVRVEIDSQALPLLTGALEAVAGGFVTRGERLNHAYIEAGVTYAAGLDPARRSLALDPQTSGGLLFFVDPRAAQQLMDALGEAGAPCAARIGEVTGGGAALVLR